MRNTGQILDGEAAGTREHEMNHNIFAFCSLCSFVAVVNAHFLHQSTSDFSEKDFWGI
jgi:hypothetical protein